MKKNIKNYVCRADYTIYPDMTMNENDFLDNVVNSRLKIIELGGPFTTIAGTQIESVPVNIAASDLPKYHARVDEILSDYVASHPDVEENMQNINHMQTGKYNIPYEDALKTAATELGGSARISKTLILKFYIEFASQVLGWRQQLKRCGQYITIIESDFDTYLEKFSEDKLNYFNSYHLRGFGLRELKADEQGFEREGF